MGPITHPLSVPCPKGTLIGDRCCRPLKNRAARRNAMLCHSWASFCSTRETERQWEVKIPRPFIHSFFDSMSRVRFCPFYKKKKLFPLIPPYLGIQFKNCSSIDSEKSYWTTELGVSPFNDAVIDRMENWSFSECPIQNSNYRSHPAFPFKNCLKT